MGCSLDAIKEAIGALPESERVALAAWLNAITMDDWDRQMHADFSRGGRAHSLVEKVREEVREGKFEPLAVRRADFRAAIAGRVASLDAGDVTDGEEVMARLIAGLASR